MYPGNEVLPEPVRVALTAGQAAVLPTTALKFEKDIYLEDNGEGLPLGNAPYTVEFWVRFGGQHGCFAGWGVEPNNQCNGIHFNGGFNHFWYANDLHCGQGKIKTKRWQHVVMRGDK